tara:strand:+ start:2121 stop:2294 length:174 start_codon:yes stop_codon:yes gene_type:complete
MNNKMIDERKLSNLSKKPPCPGKKLLESLILFIRLKKDCNKSPNKENNINKFINDRF